MRDTISATVFSTGGFRPFIDTISGMSSLFKKGEVYKDWLMSGGGNATFVSLDRQYLQQSLKNLTETTGLDQVRNLVTSPLEVLRIGAELSENATRLGLYKRKTRGRRDPTSMAEGGFESREGTLDFAKMGASMQGWNGIAAFLSARVNGYDRTVRAFKDNPVRATALATATITVPSIALWIANHDDPRYKTLPQWQKDMFWIVLTEDHVYRVPKPFELGIIFGTIPEHLLEAFVKDNPDALKDIISAFGSDSLTSLVPNIGGPILEQLTNYSLYRRAPLIPKRLEGLVPDMQYTEYTLELTKALATATSSVGKALGSKPSTAGVSPIIIENYVRQWTGGLGYYVLQLADKGLREVGLVPDPPKPADTLADIPFIKAFVIRYPSSGAEPIRKFYDRYQEAKTIRNSVEKLLEEGDLEAAEALLSLDEGAMADLSGMKESIAGLTSYVRMLYKNPDIPRDEKRQLIDDAYFMIINIAEDGNQIMRYVSESFEATPEATPEAVTPEEVVPEAVPEAIAPEATPEAVAPEAVSSGTGAIEDSASVQSAEATETPQPASAPSATGLTRGIDNNNPGNIDRTNVKWEGMGDQQDDPRFINFSSPEYGIRAISRVLQTYSVKHNLNTVEGIISRWAPPVENDTSSYIDHVSSLLGVEPDETIDVKNPTIMRALIKSIIKHENGVQPYTDEQIDSGLVLSGIAAGKIDLKTGAST